VERAPQLEKSESKWPCSEREEGARRPVEQTDEVRAKASWNSGAAPFLVDGSA